MDRNERLEGAGRQRRCALTHDRLDEADLIRFVAAPDGGSLHPDPAARAPGRGVWVRANRASVEAAAARNVFARSLKRAVAIGPDLAGETERALSRRCLDWLSLARKAGQIVSGFDQVAGLLRSGPRPAWRIEASDGASDGRRKLNGLARAWDPPVPVAGAFDGMELGMALGRETVIHAALRPGRLAEGWSRDIRRLGGFRPVVPPQWTSADP